MKGTLPPGTRAEQVEFARRLMRRQELGHSHVRLTRTQRRLAVTGLLLFLFATLGWLLALAANIVTGNKALATLYFLLGAQALCFVVLTYSVGDLNNKPNLDERERALRDHAKALAYNILMVVVALGSIAAIFADTQLHWLPAPRPYMGMTAYLAPFIWLVAGLPMAVMAWTLPDPEPAPGRNT